MDQSIRNTLDRMEIAYQIPREELERQMLEAIRAAFLDPDQDARLRQHALFPDGTPALYEFISAVVSHIAQDD